MSVPPLEGRSDIRGDARKALENAGFAVENPEQTLRELADENGTTPAALYDVLTAARSGEREISPVGSPPAGLGGKALSEICGEVGIGLDEALARLAAAGVEAEEGDTLRDLSKKYDRAPVDLWQLVNGEASAEE